MESAQFIGDAEECSSCESGWTMYIESPMHSADNADDDNDNNKNDYDDDDDEEDRDNDKSDNGDSDDSMASDASSGPCHRSNGKGSISLNHSKHDDRKYGVEKTRDEDRRIRAVKEGPLQKKNGAASLVCNSPKKKKWMERWPGIK